MSAQVPCLLRTPVLGGKGYVGVSIRANFTRRMERSVRLVSLAALSQWLMLGTCWAIGSLEHERGREAKCEAIEIPMCLGIGYNMTRMPNYMGHQNQREAAIKLHEFAPLVEYGCHVHLRLFLCSLYAPMCTDQVSTSIPACRPMCEQARQRCAPIMAQFNFGWPESLDCTKLPTRNDPNALCMEAPENATGDPQKGQGMLPVAPPSPLTRGSRWEKPGSARLL